MVHSFEDILRQPFRWPREGDEPFSEAPSPGGNARIADDDFTRLVLMIEGYKQGADLMVEQTRNDWRTRDVMVYPIIFNYRHFMELWLKYHLANYGWQVDVDANWKSHDLRVLWDEFRRVLKGYGVGDPEGTDQNVGSIISSFGEVDPASFSHRYPVDRKGNPLPLGKEKLDLENLKDVMDAIHSYFSGADGYLNDLAREY